MTLRLLDTATCQQLENAGFNFIKFLSTVNYDNKRCLLYEAVTTIPGSDTDRYYSLSDNGLKRILSERNKELYICF